MSTPLDRARKLMEDATLGTESSNRVSARQQAAKLTTAEASPELDHVHTRSSSPTALVRPRPSTTSLPHLLADAMASVSNVNDTQSFNAAGRRSRIDPGEPGLYCPLLAVSKVPYKYMDPKSRESDIVSKKCFANNCFWDRSWTAFYLQIPSYISARPLVLVPLYEVQEFFDNIMSQTGIRLKIPIQHKGFVIEFKKDGTPLPRYFGISNSRDMFNALENAMSAQAPDFRENPDGTVVASDPRSFEAWAVKVEEAIAATKNKAKANKEKRAKHRVQTKTEWSRQLRRAQRYLGIRPASIGSPPIASRVLGSDQTISSEKELSQEADVNLDVNAVVGYPFESDVVFLSIDLEVYERGHKQVTEIGLAVLDTRDLLNIPPGLNGATWINMVKGRHLWIREFAHLSNSEYVNGCPDRYEKCFGVSEMVTTQEAVDILGEVFNNPTLGRTETVTKTSTHSNQAHTTQESRSSMQAALETATSASKGDSPRRIVLVGHDINSDVAFLKMINFDLQAAPNVLEVMDTSELYRAMRHDDKMPSVSSMLYELGISGWNIHNAGNDAGYTLQGLIGIAVRSLIQGRDRLADPTALISKAKQDAEDRVRDSLQEWRLASDAEDEEVNM